MEDFFLGLWVLIWNPITYVITIGLAIWGIAFFYDYDNRRWGRTGATWILGVFCHIYVAVPVVLLITWLGATVSGAGDPGGTRPDGY